MLREYETRFRLPVDALRDDAVIGLDCDGNIRSWNSAAAGLPGFRAEERRPGDALRLANEQAEAANAAKDRFAAMLSRKMRTPLTPIRAATTFIEHRFIDQGAPLPERRSKRLPPIRRNIELEARLIDDLLDLTTISHGKPGLERAPMDLHEAMQDLIRTARIKAADNNL